MANPWGGTRILFLSAALMALPCFAAQVPFQVSSLPQQVRAEGLTEAIGAVVLQASASGIVTKGSTITLSAPMPIVGTVDNNVVSGSFGGKLCGAGFGAGACSNVSAGASGNSVTLTFSADVSFANGDYLAVLQLRGNISAVASQSFISMSLSGSPNITFSQPSVVVADVVSPSVSMGTSGPSGFTTCAVPAPQPFAVFVGDRFPGALSSLALENSFTPSYPASNGTQINVSITGVPAGLAITAQTPGSAYGVLQASGNLGTVTSTGGALTFTYTVTQDDSHAAQRDTFAFYFTIGMPNGQAGSIPAIGSNPSTVYASVSLGPTSGVPSFTGVSEGSGSITTVSSCIATPSITANSKTYDQSTTGSIATCTLTGVQPADVGKVGCSALSATFASANVGNGITVTVFGIYLTGTAASPYALSSTSATITANITKATLNVTPKPASKVYGAALPTFAAAVTGLVGNDTINGSSNPTIGNSVTINGAVTGTLALTTAANASSPVACGSACQISASGLSALNYTINYVTGTLTITPAQLTAQIGGESVAYGARIPDPGFSMSGCVNGDSGCGSSGGSPAFTGTPSYSVPVAPLPVATPPYPISGTSGSLVAPNYTFSVLPGQVTITKSSTTIAVTSVTPGFTIQSGQSVTMTLIVQAAQFGVAPTGSLLYTVDGGAAQPAALSAGQATVTLSALSASSTPHQIGFSYGGDGNYLALPQTFVPVTVTSPTTPVTAVFSVSPATLSVSGVQTGTGPSLNPIIVSVAPVNKTTWSATVSVAWLSLDSASGTFSTFQLLQPAINLQGLSQGSYTGTINFTSSAGNATFTVNLTVRPQTPAKMILLPASLNFSAIVPSITAQHQSLHVTNMGGGALTVTTAVANQPTGQGWLSVSSPTTAGAPIDLTVTVNPSGLSAAVYTGTIVVTGSDGTTTAIAVFLNASGNTLNVDHATLNLVALAGQQTAASATTAINYNGAASNTGSFTATISSPASGITWAVTPISGTTPNSLNVTATPTSAFAAGNYGGLLTVQTANAQPPNPVEVALNLTVYPATYAPAFSYLLNSGIVGIYSSGSEPQELPAPQTVRHDSSTASPAVFAIQQPAGMTYAYNPTTGIPVVTVNPAITVNGSCLQLGGTVAGDSTLYAYQYCAIGSSLIASATPSLIVSSPLFSFTGTQGAPINLQAGLYDTRGNAVTGATLKVSFSDGEPNLFLSDAGNGLYSATWTPPNSGAIALSFGAQGSTAPSVVANGTIAASTTTPWLARGGAVNAASFAPGAPLVAGSIASVFGANIPEPSSGVLNYAAPVPTTLGGLSLTVNGVPAPLYFVGQSQVNFQVPFEVAGQGSATLQLTAGTQTALLQNVPLAPASPGIFVASGTQGAIIHANGQLVNSATPAAAGEVIEIFATGLGAVTNPPTTGALAGGNSTMVTNPTVTIGGVVATVSFAGLAPGNAGLYQVNVIVPAGLATATMPVVITAGLAQSNAVTIGVH